MNPEQKPKTAEDLSKTKLSEDELKKIAGGADRNLQIDGLKGESTDSEHKD
jgi:bacteriocin-like protein